MTVHLGIQQFITWLHFKHQITNEIQRIREWDGLLGSYVRTKWKDADSVNMTTKHNNFSHKISERQCSREVSYRNYSSIYEGTN